MCQEVGTSEFHEKGSSCFGNPTEWWVPYASLHLAVHWSSLRQSDKHKESDFLSSVNHLDKLLKRIVRTLIYNGPVNSPGDQVFAIDIGSEGSLLGLSLNLVQAH